MSAGKSRPQRIQRQRTKGWRMPPNTVYVGRSTRWENPFRIGGEAWKFSMSVPHHVPENPEQVLEDYRYYAELWSEMCPGWLDPLIGKNLACSCPLDKPCHADVLLELVNMRED